MSEGASKQVQEAFREHHEEIKRRSDAAHSDTMAEHSDAFERVETDVLLPLQLPEQTVFLFSVSHIAMPPVAENPSNPGIRFYGAFETVDDCMHHATHVASLDPSCNLQMGRVQEWNMAARSVERLKDEAGCRAHVQKLLAEHARILDRNRTEFEENHTKRQGGVHDEEARAEREELASKKAEAAARRETAGRSQTQLRKAPRLPRGGEGRDCNYAVVSFIKDGLQDIPEFGFKMYACFPDLKTADIYVRNTLGNVEKEHDIDVVTIGEWLHPHQVHGSKLQSEVWRAGELSSIMTSHRQQPNKVDAFKRWRESAPADASTEPAAAATAPSENEALLDAEHGVQCTVTARDEDETAA